MWWQRLGFFKPKRLIQFGKFINTGEIGYNLCLTNDAAGKTTTDSTCFCVQSYFIRISVNTNLEQQSPHIKPDWIYGRQGEAPPKVVLLFCCIMIVDRLSSSVCRTSFYPELPRETAQLKPEASKRRTISGRALWAPKRLQFGSGKQMLVKLVMPAGD